MDNETRPFNQRLASDLHRLADIVDDDPALADAIRWTLHGMLVSVARVGDPRQAMAGFARAVLDVGGEVAKRYDDKWGHVDLTFPAEALSLTVFAKREAVCEKRVVGTREVTEEVPDPDALAAVPKVTVTKTVEDVEWDCLPLLSEVSA